MHQPEKLSKYAAAALCMICACAVSNASERQQSDSERVTNYFKRPQTLAFIANIKTVEFLLPTPLCESGFGGIGTGSGTSNLFTPNPTEGQPTNAVLTVSDCVTLTSPTINDFSEGRFTLTGAGGDSIFATYSGRIKFVSLDPTTPTIATFAFDPSTTFRIIGGTGRYSRARGNGTITGTEIINSRTKTSQGTLLASGSIIY
jgi:hypothetical protein